MDRSLEGLAVPGGPYRTLINPLIARQGSPHRSPRITASGPPRITASLATDHRIRPAKDHRIRPAHTPLGSPGGPWRAGPNRFAVVPATYTRLMPNGDGGTVTAER